jgi:predicted phage terminase large subunit-like protein
MPRPHDINPRTGKRFGWEADQARLREQELISGALQTTRKQLALLDRQKKAAEARDNLLTFIRFTMPDPADPNDTTKSLYQDAPHHRAIIKAIERVEKGDIQLLILTVGPRHGKSEIVSRRLPAWFAGRHPEQDVVVATYNDDFAEDFGDTVRSIMSSPAYKQVFPNVKLQRGGQAKSRLKTTAGGLLSFVGRGGSLTGRGSHILILDDIIKDDKEASSQAVRDQAWNWFTKVAMTRRRGLKLVILTFTRWHSDDPIGRLTDPENPHYSAKLAQRWKIINLPAIAQDDDPLGREPGKALWPDGPDRYDLEFLEEQRETLGAQAFEALYQGNPTPAEGILFDRETLKFYTPDDIPKQLQIFCTSDHAVGTRQKNDPTCILCAGVDNNDDIWILDAIWQRMPTNVAVEAMLALAKRRKPLLWWAERGHISASIGPFLRKRMQEEQIYINLVEVTPKADKATRAQSIIARAAQGKLRLPKNAPWTERAVAEMLAFPNGSHDDFVDALAYLGLGLQSQFRPGRAAEERKAAEPQPGSLAWLRQQNARDAQRHTYRGY